jgi:putative sterol carrier protein
MVRENIEQAIEKFNKAVQDDPKLQKEVKGIVRRVQIVLEDGPSYHFVLDDGHIDGLLDGPLTEAEITVTTDTATLEGIFSGEVSALRAYASKKLKLKASLQDLMTLRKFF